MLEDLILSVIKDYFKQNQVKEKMTGYMVKQKKRGTYQALQECSELENKLFTVILEYITDVIKEDILNGELHSKLKKEIKSQLYLELARNDFQLKNFLD